MFKDEYDLDVTCSSDAAMQAFLSGISRSLRFDQPAIKELTEAINQDDEFALAHAALARQLFIHGFADKCALHLDRALELRVQVTPRERDAINVIERAARFDRQAMAMAKSHVANYPQDIFVLAHLLGPFGMLAFSGIPDWAAQNVALLDATRSSYRSDDWWHSATSGFFAAEQGRLAQARKDCERAWSISENGNCAHSMVHMHFEAGALDEGRAFIDNWIGEYGDKSQMRHHIAWHTSLLDLESDVDVNETFQLYARELDPKISEATPLETFCDNASFLWRSNLCGKEIPANLVEDLYAYGETYFGSGGFAFADIHRVMATALHNDKKRHEDLLNQLAGVATKKGTQVADCMVKFAEGFGAFAGGDFDAAVSILAPLVPDSVLLGGSNPQRRIVEETYLHACLRANQYDKARAVIEARNRKDSDFDTILLADISTRDESRPECDE